MLRPWGRVGVLGSGPGMTVGVGVGVGVGVLGPPVPAASTTDWTAACAQQAHTMFSPGSVATELGVGVSEAWGAATDSDVAECWAVSVAEAFTKRWSALPEELSKPCSSKVATDHLASHEAAVFCSDSNAVNAVNIFNTPLCTNPQAFEPNHNCCLSG